MHDAVTTKAHYDARRECSEGMYRTMHYSVNKPLKICERDSGIVMTKKLLIL